jgi:hypothetical protein
MVNYYVHDGDRLVETAVDLARQHVPEGRVQSLVDGSDCVVTAGDSRLVVDLRRGKYDVYAEGEVVGKYTDWDRALAKYETLLAD